MANYRFKFKDGEMCERFTLVLERGGDCYDTLLAKLADTGHPLDGKKLVMMDYDGTRTLISDSRTLWEVIDDSRFNHVNGVTTLEYYKPTGRSMTGENEYIYFRFKEGELCRRFSLKLERNEDAYKVLLKKLGQFGYKANGRLLVCLENDGSRTIVEDRESLWTLIETSLAGGPNVTLHLEYFKTENSDSAESSTKKEDSKVESMTPTEEKLSKLEQNVDKLATIITRLSDRM
ncbi:unnamed protein product [Toxocara canis]|uniref:Ubiquitin-like domain-containing protein n=1 Tax=Toxocara canis TaxID=6265 RepID=A0A183U7E8_TOXCA|nr:unnamed protein product [Toxocara canis]